MEDWNEKGTKDFTETRPKRKYHRITDTQRYAVLPSQAVENILFRQAADQEACGIGDCFNQNYRTEKSGIPVGQHFSIHEFPSRFPPSAADPLLSRFFFGA